MKKHIISFLLFVLVVQFPSFAQSSSHSYYSSVEGLKGGETLKTALHNLLKNHVRISYGLGADATWGAFYTTDVVLGTTNQVADMYSPEIRYFGSKGSSVDGMNIEHSVPKSWWGGGQNNAYYDLHHLNPSDQTANSRKSNYPLAELSSVSWTNGISSVGKAVIAGENQNAYEPADQYKGDFARTYMYMFTCYQNLTWKYTWMVENSAYPTIKPWAVELLLKWHKQDPVSEKEIARNNSVYAIQSNRNPYVDYPRLADFVWGDSVNYIFKRYGDVEDGSGNQTGSGESGGNDGDDGNGSDGGDSGNTGNEDSKLSSDKYVLIEDAANLTVGDTIIIVYESKAMSTNQKSNNRGTTSVEIANDTIVALSDDVQKIALEHGNVNGTFAFNVGNGYLYAASSTSNYLRTQNEKDDANASWKIEIDNEAEANIVAQGDNTRNILQYNISADLFSCYKSGQQPVKIYAKAAENTTGTVSVFDSKKLVNIYDLFGRCIRQNIDADRATENLPAGLYIIDKKKVYIK